MMIIKNGRVVDPKTGLDQVLDLIIKDGKIVKVGEGVGCCDAETANGCSCDADAQVIDAAGMVVAPGLIDVHVHFRDPGLTYKEDIQTGAKAAARAVSPPLSAWAIPNLRSTMQKLWNMFFPRAKRLPSTCFPLPTFPSA